MARADLSAMLGRLADEPIAPAPAPAKAQAGAAVAELVDVQPSRTNVDTNPVPPKPGEKAGPLYSQLDRKETRLRPDQYERLTEHSRRLNRAKGRGGERITENTLIRIGIDMLLERANDLQGQTEAELRNSVNP